MGKTAGVRVGCLYHVRINLAEYHSARDTNKGREPQTGASAINEIPQEGID